ncbi:MAG: hypothetical protein RL199_2009 [Pseudomonadota bacterium]|jgi:hypothetical protein
MAEVGEDEVRTLLDELYAVRRLPKVGAYDHLPRPLRSRAFATAFIDALHHHGQVAGGERMLLHRLVTGGYVGDLEPADRWRLFIELFVLPIATRIPLPGNELAVVTAFHVFLGSPPLPAGYVSPDEAPRLPRTAVASAYEALTATLRPEDGWLRFVLNAWLYDLGTVPDALGGGIPVRPRDAVVKEIEALLEREASASPHRAGTAAAWEPEPHPDEPAYDAPPVRAPMTWPPPVPPRPPPGGFVPMPSMVAPPLVTPKMPASRPAQPPQSRSSDAPVPGWTAPRPVAPAAAGRGPLGAAASPETGASPTARSTATDAGPPVLPSPQRISLDPAVLRNAVGGALRAATPRAGIVARQLGLSTDDETPTDEQLRDFLARFAAWDWLRVPGAPSVVAVPEDEASDTELWFAGDVHGDLLGLEAVFSVFDASAAPRKVLCFLGDLVDEGPHGHEVVLRVLEAMVGRPGQIAWLAGDRDEAFSWSEERQSFVGQPGPHGWADELNALTDDTPHGRLRRAVGRWVAALVPELPRALFLPGLLAAHGGFPHTDLVDRLDAPHQLGQAAALRDFVRNRCNPEAPSRPPRRSGDGFGEFGGRDFERFRTRMAGLGLPVDAFVRGHDHLATTARWARPETPRGHFEGRVLTVNTLSFTLARESGAVDAAPRARVVTVARQRPAERWPTPVELHGPQRLVDWYAPVCPACGLPNQLGSDRCVHPRPVNGIPEPCDTPLRPT